MPPDVPLSILRAFEAAGRTGSFRTAATELGLTPSAVSHAIRKLEQTLGASLFARDNRVVRLSPEGEALMRHVGRAFEELRRGLEMVSTRGPQFLRLHSAPSFATQWLSPRLARFLRDHPGIEVRLAAGTDCTRFLNDEFDADILYGLLRQEGFVVISLGEETITPLCTSDFARVIRTPMDLFSHVLIESETKQVRWSDWFARNGLPAPGHKGSASTGASSPSPRPPTASGWLWNRRDSPSARLRAGGWYVPWPGLPTMSATSGTTWSSRGARASVTACDCS